MDDLNLDGLYSKVPKVVHDRLSEVVTEQVQEGKQPDVIQISEKRGKRVSHKKVLIVLLAAVMVLGTTVFADDIYHILIKRDGYKTEILKESEENTESLSEFEEFDYVALKYNYIPEGYVSELEKQLNPEQYLKYADPKEEIVGINKLHSENGGSISPVICEADSNDKVSEIYSTKNVEELNFVGKKVYIISKYTTDTMGFDKECYVFFEDSSYYAVIAMNSVVSMEDAKKFAQNCSLEGTNEPWMPDATVISREMICKNSFTAGNQVIQKTANHGPDWNWLFTQFHQPGETIEDDGCEFTLNSYKYIDNISEYADKGKFSIEVKQDWFDEKGNILPRHVEIVKQGDGIKTVDEVIDERDIPVKLLVVNFTVEVKENPYNETIHVMPFLELDGLQENYPEAGTYEQGGSRGHGGAIYSDIAIDEGEGFDYADLEVGDVVSYNLIYVVDEEDMEHVGLVFDHTHIIRTSFDLRPQQ